jgi:4-hydroxy-3-polyprenylbenzoate decarboxylase
VLANLLGSSRARFALALGLDPHLSARDMIPAVRPRLGRRLKPVTVPAQQAPVSEIVLRGDDIDLTKLPVPKFWPKDGGRYIGTGDLTLTRDPETGRLNAGVYRQMVQGPRRVGMYCSPGKHGRLDREAWWRRGKPCEVVAAYGIDPVSLMVGSLTFSSQMPELEVVGGLIGAPVELTPGVAGSLPIPARAEIVIEGTVTEGDVAPEGPLGEFTGYYGNPRAPQPVIEVHALHMRRNPILTAALMAEYPAGEIGIYYAILRSARIWDDLDTLGVPGIRGVWAFPASAAGWGMIAISLQQQFAGHVAQVLALAAQCPAAAYYTKWIVAVDEDVDPTDFNQLLWAMASRCNPADDIDIQRRTWSTGLDPSQFPAEARPYGSKALIDACKPHRYMAQFPERTRLRQSMHDRVRARWRELGLDGEPPAIASLLPPD